MTESWGRDAFTLLATLAVVTERIRLGTAIVNVFSRSAATLAQQFLTLNEASGGRAVAGLGVSSRRVAEDFHGVAWVSPGRRLEEYVAVLRQLFTGGNTTFRGQVIDIASGMRLRSDGLEANVPIFLGVLGPTNTRAAARAGAGWLMNWTPLSMTGDEVSRYRADAAAAGHEVEVRAPAPVVIARDTIPRQTAERKRLAFYLARMGDAYANRLTRLGYGTIVGRVRDAWASGGSAAAVRQIPGDFFDDIQLITDDIGAAAGRIRSQAEAGLDVHPVDITGFPDGEVAAVWDALRGAVGGPLPADGPTPPGSMAPLARAGTPAGATDCGHG